MGIAAAEVVRMNEKKGMGGLTVTLVIALPVVMVVGDVDLGMVVDVVIAVTMVVVVVAVVVSVASW